MALISVIKKKEGEPDFSFQQNWIKIEDDLCSSLKQLLKIFTHFIYKTMTYKTCI